MLARADADGVPCYLETFNTRLVAFYHKHGFRVVAEDRVPGSVGPRFWGMVRDVDWHRR